MRAHTEGVVGAPLEQTWRALLDVERLAEAIPGSTVRPGTPDGVRRGTLAVDGTAYLGSARLTEIDDDEHVAAFTVHGREVGGGGAVSGVIRNRLTARDGGTHVSVDADLHVTGQGRLPDGAGVLDRFVAGLEQQVLAADDTGTAGAVAAPHARPTRAVAVAAGVGVAVAVLVGWRIVRRRRGGVPR